MITAANLQMLSTATRRLYSPDLHAGNWVAHAFEFITAIVSADMVNYGDLDTATGTMQVGTTCDSSEWTTAVAGYGEFMRKYEYFDFNPTMNEGRPFFRSDFISAREFRDTDIWCECFRILGTMDHAAVHVPTGDGHLLWFAAERGGAGNFNHRDRLILTLGQEHLVNSRQLALARQNVRDEFPIHPSTFTHIGFTPRESEVAYWLIEGKANADIAALMKLRTQTVKAHVTALFNKTGIGNRLALALHLMDLIRKLPSSGDGLKIFPVRGWGLRRDEAIARE